jgi:hypothetical protein
MNITFRVVRVGEMFIYDNELYIKESTHFAKMISTGLISRLNEDVVCKI